jgi:predicted glutamine amidotransferase
MQMCELFAMSSRTPTRVTLSLGRLAARGAPEGSLADGWGVACYAGRDVRLMREPEPAGGSPWLNAALDAGRPLSHLVIAHIRHATQGALALANTQPFARELGGRMHVFAHNGMLPGVEQAFPATGARFRPVGETDSEAAFCGLLNRLAPLWENGPPPAEARLDAFRAFARAAGELGPANFLYSDGELLFAHGHRRKQSDGRISPPGLHWLKRSCDAEGLELAEAGVDIAAAAQPQQIMLFASVPLSDEAWTPLAQGEIVVAAAGAAAMSAPLS